MFLKLVIQNNKKKWIKFSSPKLMKGRGVVFVFLFTHPWGMDYNISRIFFIMNVEPDQIAFSKLQSQLTDKC